MLMIDIIQIQNILPHRYPFLLIDRVLELEPGKRIVGLKNVSVNEPFFQGHFPGLPIMPGVLIIEAMAQMGAVAILELPALRGKIALLAGIDKARFRRQVTPGDQLRIEVDVLKLRSTVGKSKAVALVNDDLAAEAELMFMVDSRIEVRN